MFRWPVSAKIPKEENMARHRRRSREAALQTLYQMDVAAMNADEGLEHYYAYFDISKAEARAFAEDLVRGVHLHRARLDELIASASNHWRVDRMAPVDRNVLRMALYEMMFRDDIPPRVSINEAIELGKNFGSEESGPFINGVLDHLLADLRASGNIAGDDEPGGRP